MLLELSELFELFQFVVTTLRTRRETSPFSKYISIVKWHFHSFNLSLFFTLLHSSSLFFIHFDFHMQQCGKSPVSLDFRRYFPLPEIGEGRNPCGVLTGDDYLRSVQESAHHFHHFSFRLVNAPQLLL